MPEGSDGGVRGSRTVKRVPSLALESTEMLPPWALLTSQAM